MSDPTNDIDALSAFLLGQSVIGPRWHAALTALVAERDALKRRVMELETELAVDTMAVIAAMRKEEANAE